MTVTIRRLNQRGHGTLELDTDVPADLAKAVDEIYTAQTASAAFFDADTHERINMAGVKTAPTIRRRLEEHPNVLIIPPMAGGA